MCQLRLGTHPLSLGNLNRAVPNATIINGISILPRVPCQIGYPTGGSTMTSVKRHILECRDEGTKVTIKSG